MSTAGNVILGLTIRSDFSGVVAGLTAATAALGALAARGVDVNSTLETTTNGIAALISAQATLKNSNSQVLGGLDAYRASLGIAADQMRKLRVAGLETAATTEQLAEAFQQALGPGLQLGLSPDDIRKITVQLTQAASAIGVPMSQLNQEMRSVLTGEINADSRINSILGIRKQELEVWKAKGIVAQELQKRLAAYAVAGSEAAKSWVAIKSNMVEALDTLASATTEGLFDKLKKAASDALSGMFDANATNLLSKDLQGLVEGLSTIFDAVGDVIAKAFSGAIELVKDLSYWMARNQGLMDGLATAIRSVVGLVEPALKITAAYIAIFEIAPFVIGGSAIALQAFSAASVAVLASATPGAAAVALLNTSLWGTSLSATAATGAMGKLAIAGGILFAAFAGWEVGKYLREQFVEVRVAGLDMVGALAKGWEFLKLAGEKSFAYIQFAWDTLLNGLRTTWSTFLKAAATGMDFLGMNETAAKVSLFADSLENTKKPVAGLGQSLSALDAQYRKQLKSIDENIEGLKDYEFAANATAKALSKTTQPGAAASVTGKPPGADPQKAAELQRSYDGLLAQIQEKVALQQAELAGGERLTEGEKLRIKTLEQLQGSLKGLSEPLRKLLLGALDHLVVLEKETAQVAAYRRATAELEREQSQRAVTEISTAQREIAALQNKIAHSGLAESAILSLAAAQLELRLATMLSINATQAEGQVTQAEIDQLQNLIRYKREAAGLTRRMEDLEQQKKAADELARKQQQMADDIERSLTDALLRGFESGKGFAENFRDTLKNMFNTLVLRPIIQAVVQPVAGSIAGLLSGGGGAGGGGNLLGNLFGGSGSGIGSLFGQGQSGGLLNTVGGWLGLGGASALGSGITAGTAATALGSGLGTGLTLGAGGVTGLTAGTGAAATLGAGATTAGAGVLSTIGAAVPWVAAAIALYSMFADEDEPRNQKLRTGYGGFDAERWSPDFMGGRLAQQTRFGRFGLVDEGTENPGEEGGAGDAFGTKEFSAFFQYFDALDRAVVESARLTQSQVAAITPAVEALEGIQIDPASWSTLTLETARQRYTAILNELGAGWGEFVQQFGGAAEQFPDYLNQVLSAFTALQQPQRLAQIGLDAGAIGSQLAGLQPYQQASETLVQTFTRVRDVFAATQPVVRLFGDDFRAAVDQFGLSSLAARQQLIDFAGGIEALGQQTQFYLQNFYSEGERLALQMDLLTYEFAALGYDSVPTTRDQFRSLIEALDLTSEAGRQAYADLMQLAPAVAAVTSDTTIKSRLPEYTPVVWTAPVTQIAPETVNDREQTAEDSAKRLAEAIAQFTEQARQSARELGNLDLTPIRRQVAELQQGLADEQQQIWNDAAAALGVKLDPTVNAFKQISAANSDLASAAQTAAQAVDALANRHLKDLIQQAGRDAWGKFLTASGGDAAGFTSQLAGANLDQQVAGLNRLFGTTEITVANLEQLGVQYWSTMTTTQRAAALDALNAKSDYLAAIKQQFDGQLQIVQDWANKLQAVGDFGKTLAADMASLQIESGQLDRGQYLRGREAAIRGQFAANYANGSYSETHRIEEQLTLAQELRQVILDQYQAQIEGATKLRDFARGLRDYVDSLKVGELSPYTIKQRLDEAEAQYRRTLSAAQGGDEAARGLLQGKADAYLKLSQDYFAKTGAQNFANFDQVVNDLSALGVQAEDVAQQTLGLTSDIATRAAETLNKLRDLQSGVQQVETALGGKLDGAVAALQPLADILNALGAGGAIAQAIAGLSAALGLQVQTVTASNTSSSITGGTAATSVTPYSGAPTGGTLSMAWNDAVSAGDIRSVIDSGQYSIAQIADLANQYGVGATQIGDAYGVSASEILQIAAANGVKLNAYAAGGIIDRPEVALIGEAGMEAVIPMPGGRVPVQLLGGGNGNNPELVALITDLVNEVRALRAQQRGEADDDMRMQAEVAQRLAEATAKAAQKTERALTLTKETSLQ